MYSIISVYELQKGNYLLVAGRSLTECQQFDDCQIDTHYTLFLLVHWQKASSYLATTVKRVLQGNVKRVSVSIVQTCYRQVTDMLLTHHQLLADSRPTGFLGSSSSQLPICLPILDGCCWFYVESKFVLYCIIRLDLDKWINDPPSESSEEEEEMETIFDTPNEHKYDHTVLHLL